MTGFWQSDIRAPLAPAESKTWSPIYLWADPSYAGGDVMHFAMEADQGYAPPKDRPYTLELLAVPVGVQGAPPVGTQWAVPLNDTLVLTLPTYRTDNGLTGYQFGFTVGAQMPEPASLAVLVLVLGTTRRRR